MSDTPLVYIQANRERFVAELQQFLRFPSISAQPEHKQDLLACAAWLRQHLQDLGLEAELIPTAGHPIVSARASGRTDRTLIIYGHYDVQPTDPREQWQTPPFEPTVRQGYLYARGATDDKGQLFAHVKAVEALLRTQGGLKHNVRFLIEGEEECGGTALQDYVRRHRRELSCAGVIISDTALFDERTPAITYGLRGLVGFAVTVKGPSRQVHSGSFGGAIANPAVQLCHVISRCLGADGRILIPGFYDDVRPLSPWEWDNLEKIKWDDTAMARTLGVPRLFGEPGFPPAARVGARPTFEVNGLWGGYTGPGSKTIIPASAAAKITMRLVPDQDWRRAAEHAVAHMRAVCSDAVTFELGKTLGANPVLFDVEAEIIQAARPALRAGFGAEPVFLREGGSIPVAETFAHQLGAPVLLMGFGLTTDGAHAPNERFKIDNFINGARTSALLLQSA